MPVPLLTLYGLLQAPERQVELAMMGAVMAAAEDDDSDESEAPNPTSPSNDKLLGAQGEVDWPEED